MKSLKSIIILSIIGLTLLGSVVLSQISITFSNNALKDVYTSDIQKMTNIIAEVVYDENKLRLDLITDLSALPTIRDSSIPMIEKQKQLQEIAKKDKNFLDIYVVDVFGMYTDFNGVGKFISTRQDFIKARGGTPAVYGPVLDAEIGSLVFYYSVPIYDENNNISTVLSLTSDGKMLSSICEEYVIGDNSHPMIVEKETVDLYGDSDFQKVINRINIRTESKQSRYEGYLEALNSIKDNKNGVHTYKDNKETMFFVFSEVEDTSWAVCVSIPLSELNNKTSKMRNNMTIASIVLLIVGFLVAFYIAKNINPLKVLGKTLVDIGSGNADLTSRLKFKGAKKEIRNVESGFNNFVAKLHEIVSNIRDSESVLLQANSELQSCADETSASITQIIANIKGVTSEIANETNSVSETAGAVQQIAANIQSLERMIEVQVNNVQEATSAVEEMVGNINSVNNSVGAMVKSFDALEENARVGIVTQTNVNERLQKIDEESKMLQEANLVISEIAEQTNLLAMNAAIEAAHAGEAGKGFSVVADEIRKLSETSAEQSQTIGEELSSIQNSINYVVEESNKASAAFSTVADNIKKTDEVIQLIRGAMEEQQLGSKQITDSLYSMNNSTTEVRQAAKEMSLGNDQILSEIKILENATNIVNSSIEEMETGAQSITDAGSKLMNIAKNVSTSVETIHTEIGQFKV